ncbi:hypothetical protein [Pedobacter sp. ASV28]|uniref:hypothetical protein n=1 Tax=Pedobacter sp. ASV28 TaxID=2795123 RepID=UPI0018EAE8D4|nr:hypothetical protein [Pedobacter sp. ASV28]
MKNRRNITSLADLHLETSRLKADYQLKEVQLKADVKTYIKHLSPFGLIKNYLTPNSLFKIDEKTNISGKIMSFVLPFILNKTLFRGSGFLTKGIAALVSSKMGKSLDAENLTGIFHHIKSFFAPSKKNKDKFVDYGIPPDSETY